MTNYKIVSFAIFLAMIAHDVVQSADMQQLLELDETIALQDPVLWKTWNAAKYADAAENGQKDEALKLGTALDVANTTLLLTSSSQYSLIMAFADHGGSFKDLYGQNQVDVPFLQDFLEGSTSSSNVVRTFSAYEDAGASSLHEYASQAIKGESPVNVLCTGQGGGGTFVPICALWAAITYPNAHILAISFGGAWAGNNKFNWTLTQLVDQYYFWPETAAGFGEGTIEDLSITEILDSLDDGLTQRVLSTSNDEVRDGVKDIMTHATTVHIFNSDGEDVTPGNAPPPDVTDSGDVINITMKGEEYSKEQLDEMVESYQKVEGECPLVLCKTRTPALMDALIYEEYDPANPDWHGPVHLPKFFPGTVMMLNATHDADAAVYWNKTSETAYFIFRGSESKRDWMANANAVQRDFPTTAGLKNLYDSPEVHMGFLGQFEAMTTDAKKEENKIDYQMSKLLKGKVPKVVVCTGQSLGGALSTLCGPWAAVRYPKSVVMVINEGSPKVGDEDFKTFFNQILGRAYRMVNGVDQVPLLAPLPNYVHVDQGVWINDDMFILQARPPLEMRDSNWIDHNYYTYSYMQNTINQTSVPDWAKDLSNPGDFADTSDFGGSSTPSDQGSPATAGNSASRSAAQHLLFLVVGVACLLAML